MIKEDFKVWACEYSGILGGNPNGDLWVCGIEYGGNEEGPKLHQDHKTFEKEGLPCWDMGTGGVDYTQTYPDCTAWQFQQKIAKISLTMKNKDTKDYKLYIKEELCRSNENTFLLNLYPLRFKKSDDEYWTKKHYDLTGFPNKIAYKAWCMKHRFPTFRDLVKKYKPKALICSGAGYASDFKCAFLPSENYFDKGIEHELPKSKKKFHAFKINNNQTTLLITPFLGQGGIMSDEDLGAIAYHFINAKSLRCTGCG